MYSEILSCSCFVGFILLSRQPNGAFGDFFHANSRLVGLIYAVTFVYYFFKNDLYFSGEFWDFAYMLGIFSFERLVLGLNKDCNCFKYVLA